MKQDSETSAYKIQILSEKNVKLSSILSEMRENEGKSLRLIEELKFERDHLKEKLNNQFNLMDLKESGGYSQYGRTNHSSNSEISRLEQACKFYFLSFFFFTFIHSDVNLFILIF